jgi:hypothetical protein
VEAQQLLLRLQSIRAVDKGYRVTLVVQEFAEWFAGQPPRYACIWAEDPKSPPMTDQ